MKHETARASVFAMPLTNPAFPSSPYRFVNREYFKAAQRGISQKEATEELLAEKQPSLDFASPAQLGGTVAFLCSSAADEITGTAISVDGGWTAQ